MLSFSHLLELPASKQCSLQIVILAKVMNYMILRPSISDGYFVNCCYCNKIYNMLRLEKGVDPLAYNLLNNIINYKEGAVFVFFDYVIL